MADDPDLPRMDPSGRRFLAWSSLVRALGLAADTRKLILGVVGLALLIGGWRLIDRVSGLDSRTNGRIAPGDTIRRFESPVNLRWSDVAWLISEPPRTVVGPFAELFTRGVGVKVWCKAAAMGVWALIVWGIIGGAIARIAVLQMTVGGGAGVLTALRFAFRHWMALIGAPLTPFLAILLIAGGCAGFGLLAWIPGGIGTAITSLLYCIPLLGGLLMALILLGLGLGWPLMHATVAAEGEDIADALSRSYSYVNQRLVRYLAHLTAAWIFGIFGLVVAVFVARVVLGLADWSVHLAAPTDPATIPVGDLARAFWLEAAGWLTHAYIYSYFWSASAVIYLILRQDVDGTDMYDVFLPDQAADTFNGVALPADGASTPTPATPDPTSGTAL